MFKLNIKHIIENIFTLICLSFLGKCGVAFKEKVEINSTFYPASHYEDIREEPPNILCCVNPINITEVQLNYNDTNNSTQFDVPVNSTEASYIANQTTDCYAEIIDQHGKVTKLCDQSDAGVRFYNQSDNFPRGSGKITKYSVTITLFCIANILACIL